MTAEPIETAATVVAAPAPKGGKHRSTRTRRLPSLPSLPRRNKTEVPAVKPAKAPKAKAVKPAKAETVQARITRTGKAMYSVDSDGVATPNLGLVGVNGFATFAVSAGEAIRDVSQPSLFAAFFETAEQQARRTNWAAVGQTLVLIGSTAARVAASRK